MSDIRRVSVVDTIDLPSARELTKEGYLRAPAKIGRSGVQIYAAHELKIPGSDANPNQMIKLFRPAEEVFNPAAMKSFESQPLADNHPKAGQVNSLNWRGTAVGDVRDIAREGDFLCANVIVRDEAMKQKVVGGKSQLSCGYDFDLDMTPGTTEDGQAYDGIQRNIAGNHVAIVDSARAGWGVRIADTGENVMADQAFQMVRFGTRVLRIHADDAQIALDAYDQHEQAVKTAKTALESMQSSHKNLQSVAKGHEDRANAAEKALSESKDDDDDKEEGEDDDDEMMEGADGKPMKAADSLAKRVVRRVAAIRAGGKKKLDAQKTAHDAAIADIKAKIPTEAQIESLVEERTEVTGAARRIAKDSEGKAVITTKGKTLDAIRREVLTHVVTAGDAAMKPVVVSIVGADVAKADASQVKTAFGAIVALAPKPEKTGGNDAADIDLGRRMAGDSATTGAGNGGAGADKPAFRGRAAMMARSANGGKLPGASA